MSAYAEYRPCRAFVLFGGVPTCNLHVCRSTDGLYFWPRKGAKLHSSSYSPQFLLNRVNVESVPAAVQSAHSTLHTSCLFGIQQSAVEGAVTKRHDVMSGRLLEKYFFHQLLMKANRLCYIYFQKIPHELCECIVLRLCDI